MLDRLEIIDYLLAANNRFMFVKYLISIRYLKVNICNTLLQKANALQTSSVAQGSFRQDKAFGETFGIRAGIFGILPCGN